MSSWRTGRCDSFMGYAFEGGFDLHTDGVADRRASRAAVRLSFSSQCLSPKESRRGPDDMATDAAALDSRCAARSRSLPAGRWKQGHPPYTRQHRRGLIQRQDRGMPACSVVSQNGAYAVGTGLPRKSQRHAGQIPGTKKPTIRSVFSGFWCPEGDSNSHSFRKRILNPPRLPIPPSGLVGAQYREPPWVGQSGFMVNFRSLG